MTYKLTVDIDSAITDLYPGLSDEQVEKIAYEVYDSWDYSLIYEHIHDMVVDIATHKQINLEDKL